MLLFWGRFSEQKPLSQIQRSTLSRFQHTFNPHSFGGFGLKEAGASGIIGGADGPTTIFASAKLAPDLLGVTAVVAYSYMASVVFIQPPLMRLLTTQNERQIRMRALREVSKTEKPLFPAGAMIIIILFVPESAPLIAMFMIGNLFGESGVVPRSAPNFRLSGSSTCAHLPSCCWELPPSPAAPSGDCSSPS